VSQNDAASQAKARVAEGKAFLADRRPEDALASFVHAQALDPDLVEARIGAGWADLDLGDPLAALAQFEDAASRDPSSSSAALGCARALVRAKRLEQAIWRYDQAWKLDSSSAVPLMEAGEALLDSRRRLGSRADGPKRDAALADAHALFAKATEVDPKAAGAWLGLGQCQMEARSFTEALGVLRRALEADPSLVEANICIAEAANELERYKEALVAIEPVATVWDDSGDPDSLELPLKARVALIFALEGLRRWEEAHHEVEKVTKLLSGSGDEVEIYRHAFGSLFVVMDSSLLLELGRLDEAIALAREATKSDGSVVALAQQLLARAQSARGDYEGAAKTLADAEDMYANAEPNEEVEARVTVAQLRCAALSAIGRADEAYALLKGECDALPDQVELHMELVRLSARERADSDGVAEATWQHRLLCATGATRDALEPCKDLPSALLSFGMLDIASGNADRARSSLEKEVSRDPESREAHALLGAANAHVGDYGGAVRSFAAAVRLAPFNLSYKLALATAYFHLGNADAAERGYREVLRTAPENVEALVGLGAVLGSREEAEAAIYDEATQHLEKALCLAETMNGALRDQKASIRLSAKRRAAIHHQIGCAAVRKYEADSTGSPVGRRSRTLRRARNAFSRALTEDPSLFRAERAKAMVQAERKALAKAGPKWIVMAAICTLLVLLALSFFFHRPRLDQLDGPTFSVMTLGLLALLMAAGYLDRLRTLSVAGVSMEKEVEVEAIPGKLGIEGDPTFIDLIPLELEFPSPPSPGDAEHAPRARGDDSRRPMEAVDNLRQGSDFGPDPTETAREGASSADPEP